jgi:hypothetical protein
LSQFAADLPKRAAGIACDNRPVRLKHVFFGLILASAGLSVAGCGGTSTYSADKTRACLEKAGARVTAPPRKDFVASAAEGDSFGVHFRDNLVTISFGLDRNGAERIVRGYERFRGQNIGLEDVLRVSHNAVMLWEAHPADAYTQAIAGCLK